MRTLGDHRWLNDYIGLPYVLGGRDLGGLDCFGLLKMVYDREYGETLPDWQTDDLSLRGRAETIASVVCSGAWEPVEDPQDGDFVVCYRSRAPLHLGLYFAGGVLHAMEGLGVVFEPLDRFQERFARVEFGEWHP